MVGQELTGAIRGRAPAVFHAEVIRELDETDLLLRRATVVGSESRPLVKLRHQHHKLAQLLANGSAEGEASLLTGYSLSRISILKGDPAFKELLAHYTNQSAKAYADLQTRMAGFSLDALDELQDRLEMQPDSYTNRELIEAVKVTNDRGGNSPIHRSQATVAVLTASDIVAIKQEVKAAENGRIIEVSKIIEAIKPALENNPGVEMGEGVGRSSANDTEEATLERVESPRENV